MNGSKCTNRRNRRMCCRLSRNAMAASYTTRRGRSAWSAAAPMPRCWRRASTAPAAGSAIRRARPTCSTPAVSARRRKRAISSHCSDRLAQAGPRGPMARAGGGGVAREKRLEARDVEAIFRAFAEVLRELPPDTEAGFLDAEGDLRLAPDIGRKLRTARGVRDVLREIREAQGERHC